MADDEGDVLIIYTGGTLGSIPEDRLDPLSPLVPGDLDEVMSLLPRYEKRQLALGDGMVTLGLHSWEKPLDSSNITSEDWVEMAAVIRDNYERYNGFIILHGTDTMAYTASALAFMLENLEKPVIITGSQLPIGVVRSDAVQNLVTSIEIAAAKALGGVPIPEVMVFFRDELLRGCCTTKLSASSYSGFGSPNFDPLGRAGEHIRVRTSVVRGTTGLAFRVNTDLETNIACLPLIPSMSPDLLDALINMPKLRGIVLRTFGAGNAPTTPEFLTTVQRAVEGGKIVVDVTQCPEGEVELGLYEVSAGLLARGVITGLNMTAEAALTKLAVLLGNTATMTDGETPEPIPLRVMEVADRMQLNLRGEQRQSIFHLHFGKGNLPEDGADDFKPLAPMTDSHAYSHTDLETALLRITGLRIPDSKRGQIEFRVFIDLPTADAKTSVSDPHYLGEASKRWRESDGDIGVFIDVTEQIKTFVDNRRENTLRLVSTSGEPIEWDRLDLAFYTRT